MSDIEAPLSALAFCWRIERRDGAGLGLTSHDRALWIDGQGYDAAPGMLPSAIVRSIGMTAGTGDVEGALTSHALSEEELVAGRWDRAAVSLTAVEWDRTAISPRVLGSGELGEIIVKGDQFSAELRGAAAELDSPLCPETSPHCRAELGDKKCRVDLAGRLLRVRVNSLAGATLTIDQAVDSRFAFGRLRWLTGPAAGLHGTILSASGTSLLLRDMPRVTLGLPAIAELREGCDKTLGSCSGRFNNAVNFRGEPHLPGNDLLTRYPGGNG